MQPSGWQHRGWLEISIAILSACQQERVKTQVMYEAKVNNKMMTRYLDILTEKGLLSKLNNGKYVATPKGKEFVTKYRNLSIYLK